MKMTFRKSHGCGLVHDVPCKKGAGATVVYYHALDLVSGTTPGTYQQDFLELVFFSSHDGNSPSLLCPKQLKHCSLCHCLGLLGSEVSQSVNSGSLSRPGPSMFPNGTANII